LYFADFWPNFGKIFAKLTHIAAMKKIEIGIDAGEVKFDNTDNFIASMM